MEAPLRSKPFHKRLGRVSRLKEEEKQMMISSIVWSEILQMALVRVLTWKEVLALKRQRYMPQWKRDSSMASSRGSQVKEKPLNSVICLSKSSSTSITKLNSTVLHISAVLSNISKNQDQMKEKQLLTQQKANREALAQE